MPCGVRTVRRVSIMRPPAMISFAIVFFNASAGSPLFFGQTASHAASRRAVAASGGAAAMVAAAVVRPQRLLDAY